MLFASPPDIVSIFVMYGTPYANDCKTDSPACPYEILAKACL